MTPKNKAVSRDQWLKARKALLAKEKAFTRERDRLTAARRRLPWEAVTKEYVFEGANGRQTLSDLLEERNQLVVYHFMFHPDWDAGCPHCSHFADSFDRPIIHLNHRDVTMIAVSRAPYAKLEAYKKRMGWSFAWFSSFGNDFNFDFNVSFSPEEMKKKKAFYNFKQQNPDAPEREGISVFYKDPRDRIFRTYSTFARGIDPVSVDYQILDLVPKGRDEGGRGPFWVRRHDEYGS